jgi:hypothetical protein
MNPYIILAAYRLSIKAAENIVLVQNANSNVEIQMRDRNGELFHRIQLRPESP